jgi:hypothetical protein
VSNDDDLVGRLIKDMNDPDVIKAARSRRDQIANGSAMTEEEKATMAELWQRPSEKITVRDLTSFDVDLDRGQLLERWNGAIQAMVDVRQQVKEEKLRELLIAELRHQGYVVTPRTGDTVSGAALKRRFMDAIRPYFDREDSFDPEQDLADAASAVMDVLTTRSIIEILSALSEEVILRRSEIGRRG